MIVRVPIQDAFDDYSIDAGDAYCVACGYPFNAIDDDGRRTMVIIDTDTDDCFCSPRCARRAAKRLAVR